jgi:Zn-dependent peptidase ImmA (M78 family)
MISINADYNETSRRLLCAHELGHALLHSNGVNHYSIASNYELERLERDANLFALSLLYDDINR